MDVIKKLRKQRTFQLTTGEMFCGPGGIGLALSNTKINQNGFDASYRHVFATDYDRDTCDTYGQNVLRDNPDASVICADVRKLDVSSLAPVDGFLYGFPCNDFSLVGESLGLDGSFGGLYKYGVDYIQQANPMFLLAENVSGIGSANSGNAFRQILSDLNHAGTFGYNLTVHHYKFEQYGIPQARHRYIIVGMRGDLELDFLVPKPQGITTTCQEAIEQPPINPDASNHELSRHSQTVIERLKYIKPGENVWNAEMPDEYRLNVSGARLSQIYKRLDPSKPAYTITGSGGGGTHVYHWLENRALSNRERARLQTFPDNFVFCGSKESVRSQIGMAVPVKGAEIILTAVLKTICGIDYEAIRSSHGTYAPRTLTANIQPRLL
jgi:DNA (cytosine-5)-methyltransferase 1